MIGKLRELRVYSPPLPWSHPDFIEPAFRKCGRGAPRHGGEGFWLCTAKYGHLSDHAAHQDGLGGVVMLARWPRETQPETEDVPDTDADALALLEATGEPFSIVRYWVDSTGRGVFGYAVSVGHRDAAKHPTFRAAVTQAINSRSE